ncbi:TrmH family RNA methyltransferase [Corynebacterium pilosum]|uniref:rRNA methylase n=1 Tax=Corynebacterium pilosum TaxID=35756 RepID=A0A376CNY5_9CORY|nr:RNA methyltransferase [Corynebacterium pilosum]STC69927.1 rRNA methylase [Corynebacterium pilosum]
MNLPAPQLVTDPTDPRLDDIRDLKRNERKLVIAEGPLIAGRLVESRYPLRCIIGFQAKLASFLEELSALDDDHLIDCPIYEVSRETLAAVAGFDMHRGLLAVADRAEESSLSDMLDMHTLVVLEGVGDHENIGSIFRNAAGMDVDGVLLGSGTADPLYRRSVRVSMGHVLRTPWARLEGGFTTWQRSLEELREAGFRLISLTPHPEAVHIAEALVDKQEKPWEKVALLVGGEGPGLTEHAMRATDVRARIPMAVGTDSLNVATSAAIAFYERQRGLRVQG